MIDTALSTSLAIVGQHLGTEVGSLPQEGSNRVTDMLIIGQGFVQEPQKYSVFAYWFMCER